MMKKLSALLMALVMCVSLVACGGADPQPAIDSFNSASDAYDTLIDKINANIEAYPQDLLDAISEMGSTLTEYKDMLESDREYTEEEVTGMVEVFTEVENWAKDMDAQLEELAVEAVVVDKQLAIELFNGVSTMFDAAGTVVNANPDAFSKEFTDTMVEMAGIMSEYKTLLESDQELTEEEFNIMVEDLIAIEEWLVEAESQLFG
ncbi:MAG: hypothetical protein J6A94_04955 [Lachnospiraceae bacterium]|nr:hypothetical protein [Lachnospiraceae bacterium]